MPATNADAAAGISLCYAGTANGIESRLATAAGLEFAPIHAGQMRIRNPFKLAVSGLHLMRGAIEARRLIRRWQPHVLFATGGYVCAPVVWAAHRQDVPILIYLPDMVPGIAVQRLARYADKVAVSFPQVAEHFPGKALVTGYPVRAELLSEEPSPAAACRHFQLDPERPTVVIFGGSRGARSINVATAAMLPTLLAQAQVIHITGTLDWPQAQQRAAHLSQAQRSSYRPFPYLDADLPLAFRAADLAIARAGAATLGELPAVGLPAILVPLPISGGHQIPNARYLADRGAAVIVNDADMSEQLLPTTLHLLQNRPQLEAMAAASKALAQPHAAEAIAAALLGLNQTHHATP